MLVASQLKSNAAALAARQDLLAGKPNRSFHAPRTLCVAKILCRTPIQVNASELQKSRKEKRTIARIHDLRQWRLSMGVRSIRSLRARYVERASRLLGNPEYLWRCLRSRLPRSDS